jgi:hypothetical protein
MRPTSVTLLALAVLSLAAFHLLGVVSGGQRYTFLSTLPLSLPPAYVVIGNAVWGTVFGVMAVGLWRLRHWGRVGTLIAFSLYVAHAWLERLLFARSDYARVTAPYALALDLLGLGLVWGVLLRRTVRQQFSGRRPTTDR